LPILQTKLEKWDSTEKKWGCEVKHKKLSDMGIAHMMRRFLLPAKTSM
jgi:hypothetical protein